MSLTKLLKCSSKLFKKDIISFLIVRRHDLGLQEENLRYISVRPNSSISVLRHKVWHLLDLPDFCDEIIVLKSQNGIELPLLELHKGNTPQNPYVLEVWPPRKHQTHVQPATCTNMLTMGDDANEHASISHVSTEFTENEVKICPEYNHKGNLNLSQETMLQNKHRVYGNKNFSNKYLQADYKKSDISTRISSSSLFKLQGRKSRDNFTNILLKIQSDLSTLSNKLSELENRIPTK